MIESKKNNCYLFYFVLLYAFTYMSSAVYSNFIPVYLNHLGYNKTNIGLLLSIAPFIAIMAQPIWGLAADYSRTKNTILQILIIGSSIAILLYRLWNGFYYLSIIIALFTFFQTSIYPISDAITLEYSQDKAWKFGHIRMAGTIGFALASILAGYLAKKNVGIIFILYFILAMAALSTSMFLPKLKGHQTKAKKISFFKLFQYKKLMFFMSLNLVIQITLGFYYTFFPIYFNQLGATNSMLGWAMFISSMSEIPFLLFAHRILRKIKVETVLIFSACIAMLRWLLLSSITNTYIILTSQLLHGLIFVVISLSIATYINDIVPNALKASGQAFNALIGLGLARIIGSLFGGYLSDLFGIKNMFLYNSIFLFIFTIFFVLIVRQEKKPAV